VRLRARASTRQPPEGKPKGFGSSAPAAGAPAAAPGGGSAQAGGYWTALDVRASDLEAKSRLPVILANGTALIVWLVDGKLYCSAANSTAYQYPLLDAELLPGPVVRSTLDGTTYELSSGKVLEWCPKEEATLSLRNVLAGLKQSTPPVDLAVYATRKTAVGVVEVLIPVKA
jgi:nitrite reductase/ring-hydroxylating ferredoxin subunit